MTKVAIMRCEKNQDTCPMKGCFMSLRKKAQGFAEYEDCELSGVFTCRCPGDNAVELAKILKDGGSEAIHFTTCAFAGKEQGAWIMGKGFCDHLDEIMSRISDEVGIRCVKGSAHLPKDYEPETF